jgi:hypothetical protein
MTRRTPAARIRPVPRRSTCQRFEEIDVSVGNLWLQMLDSSLVRADQVTEITLHQTPDVAGKPSRWLLDIAVAVPVGAGDSGGWHTGPLYRTLAQTDQAPHGAPAALARLLAQLDGVDAAGIVRADASHLRAGPHPEHTLAAGVVRFGFTAFAGAERSDPSTPARLGATAAVDRPELTSPNLPSSRRRED